MHGSLIKIRPDSEAVFIDTDLNGIDTYQIETNNVVGGSWLNQKTASFEIYALGVVTSDSFARFSSIGNSNKINTTVQVIGQTSGASIVIPVTISQS